MSVAKKQGDDEETAIILPARVCEQGRTISIRLMINGLPEDELQIDLEKTELRISASNQNMKARTFSVPRGSRIRKKTYHNGLLKVILEMS